MQHELSDERKSAKHPFVVCSHCSTSRLIKMGCIKLCGGVHTTQGLTPIKIPIGFCANLLVSVSVSVSGSANVPLTGDGSNGNAKFFKRTTLSNSKCFLKGHFVEFLIVYVFLVETIDHELNVVFFTLVGIVTCSGHEHKKEHIYLDEVYHFNVDKLFELLFTDSEFYRNFLNARKTFGK